ncbi:MAG: hypothetical protein P4M11_02725 [Candidatus Pacebacteria bacterium]|nr:hypothetical protein [Candidatus Paceibacterota bacterium]
MMKERFVREIEHNRHEVVVSNLQKVRSKLKQLAQDGPGNLIIITGTSAFATLQTSTGR